MADVYDLPVPTVAGTAITADWLANDPRRIYRLLRTLVMQRLIGYKLLTGRVDLTGTGFGIYEVSESIFVNGNGQVVRPLSQYPIVQTGVPTLATVRPDKNGLKTLISDESIAHNRIDVVMRDLVKMANSLVFSNDALTLAAIASAVTKTHAAADLLTGPNAYPWLDVELSAASIMEENQGYAADTVATTPTLFARAIASAIKSGLLPREAGNPMTRADINSIMIGGKLWLQTTNMPAGVNGIVLDSAMLGSQAYERLGGGYQGDAADVVAGVETKRHREDDIDGVTVQARIVRAPMVQEPNSARVITGWV